MRIYITHRVVEPMLRELGSPSTMAIGKDRRTRGQRPDYGCFCHRGRGVADIRERVSFCGSEFHAGRSNAGFTVRVRLPLEAGA